ncbi:hypothetical protein [Halorarum salinum]|uniref:Uncharacterized protein n=1 Tax=Halorarum salinum TaxID=2743089 RepID=A0A7D5QC60_9EURY|nr:hypothetical protein [Halobaculum salinum]QLG63896.1 hypothetical protein HUG12_20100 [Halobaculum salinum]
MSRDDSMTRAEISDRISRARSLIQEVRDDAAIPVVATSAHQADVLCHRIMWEMGAESGTTPELEEPIEREDSE